MPPGYTIDIKIKRQIAEDFKRGVSMPELAKKYLIKRPTLWYYVHGKNMSDKIGNKKYIVNGNYFSNINDEGSAYWLGFLCADGYVRMVGSGGHVNLTLKISDKHHVELFQKCIESNHPIRDKNKNRLIKNHPDEIATAASLDVHSTKMYQDLVNHGCMRAKTFKLRWPTFLRDDLVCHFIRGYFDGDGCIHKRKCQENGFVFQITGNEQFLEGMQNAFQSKFGIKSYLYPQGNVFNLLVRKMSDVLTIRNFLYKNATLFLKRKRDIFNMIDPFIIRQRGGRHLPKKQLQQSCLQPY